MDFPLITLCISLVSSTTKRNTPPARHFKIFLNDNLALGFIAQTSDLTSLSLFLKRRLGLSAIKDSSTSSSDSSYGTPTILKRPASAGSSEQD